MDRVEERTFLVKPFYSILVSRDTSPFLWYIFVEILCNPKGGLLCVGGSVGESLEIGSIGSGLKKESSL